MLFLTFLLWALNFCIVNVYCQSITSKPFTNTSVTAATSSPAITSCPFNCTLDSWPRRRTLTWSRLTVNTTITHATVIAFVNNANQTSYSTKFNTDVLGNFTLPSYTNSAGTVTMAVTDYDSALGRNVTKTAAYPNLLPDYDNEVIWNGMIPTATNASSQCITAMSTTTQLLPSHPFLDVVPAPITGSDKDPRGWLYTPVLDEGGFFEEVTTLFPSFKPFQCSRRKATFAAPAQALFTASFATLTQTSHVNGPLGGGPSPPSGPGPAPPQTAVPTANPGGNPQNPTQPGNPIANPQNPGQPSQPHNPGPASPPNPPQGGVPANPPNQPQRPAPVNPPTQPGQNNPPSQPGSNPSPQPANPAPVNPPSQNGPAPGGQSGNSQSQNGGPSGSNNPPNSNQPAAPGGQPAAPGQPANNPGVGAPLPGASNQGSGGSSGPNQPSSQGQAGAPNAPVPIAAPQITVGGNVITGTQQSAFVAPAAPSAAGGPAAPGVTLAPGVATNVGGTPVSVNSAGNVAVVGGTTQSLAPAAPLIVNGQSFAPTAGAPAFVVGGQTVAPGAPAQIISGQTISLASNGQNVIIGGSTQAVAQGSAAGSGFTAAGATFTPVASGGSGFAAGSTTIRPGAVATVNGQAISVVPNGASAVVGGSTIPLATAAATGGVRGGTPITAGPSTFTQNAQGAYVAGSLTLTPGQATVVGGTTLALASGGSSVVVNGQTRTLVASAGAGLSPGVSVTGTGTTARYTGGAARSGMGTFGAVLAGAVVVVAF